MCMCVFEGVTQIVSFPARLALLYCRVRDNSTVRV